MKRILVPLLVLSMIFSAVYSFPTAGQIENELIIVSPHSKGILDSYKAGFEKYCNDVLKTPVTLKYSFYASEDCYKLAKEWGGKPKADIWWGGGINLFQAGAKDGLLLAYKSKNWANIPATYAGIPAKDPNGYWTGYAVSGFGLQLHTDYLKRYNLAEPKTWADLLNPVYRGHIVMCTPARSGSTHMMAEIVLQGMGYSPGWAYLRKMAVNVGLFTPRSADVKNDVDKGEHGIGLVVDYYGFDSAAAGLPVKLVYPGDFSFANPDSIAILAGVPHVEVAKAFVDYVLSEEGQKLGMGIEQRGVKCPSPRLPIRADVAIPPSLPDITKVKMIAFNDTLSTARYREINTIYEDTIEKKHAELKDSWNALEAAQKAIDETNTRMSTMEKEGYDVAKVKTELAKAKDLVATAQKSFDTGDYAAAKTSAGKASDTAKASIGLAEKPPPYTTYAAVAVVVLILIAAFYMFYSKKKKAK